MPPTVATAPPSGHRLLSDVPTRMAKAAMSNVRKADDEAWRLAVGQVIRRVRGSHSLKEFAAVIERDERQIARWEDGKERPHVDALFAVEALRQPLVLAFAELAGEAVEVVTEIRVRKSA